AASSGTATGSSTLTRRTSADSTGWARPPACWTSPPWAARRRGRRRRAARRGTGRLREVRRSAITTSTTIDTEGDRILRKAETGLTRGGERVSTTSQYRH